MVLQQMKVLLLSIVAVFRRALCCFSRRRKQSLTDVQEGLQSISVVDNDYNVSKRPNAAQSERDWNSWDDSPRTVEEHIEQYRQRLGKPPTPQKEEPEPDFFSELAPVIKPQPKYYLTVNAQEKADFSRLKATVDVPIPVNADLEDWVDEDAGGWEELNADTTKELIREKRREMRNQRQKLTAKAHGIDYQGQDFRNNASPANIGMVRQT